MHFTAKNAEDIFLIHAGVIEHLSILISSKLDNELKFAKEGVVALTLGLIYSELSLTAFSRGHAHLFQALARLGVFRTALCDL